MYTITESLKQFVDSEILPLYDQFDAAHQRAHALQVIAESMHLMILDAVKALGAEPLNADMVYAIAAYHDVGLSEDRATHHLVSGRRVRTDRRLLKWFTPQQIELMAQAVEDHRASATHAPRSIYGCIVAEADRNIDIEVIMQRTLQYGLAHYPELERSQHIERALQHLHEKYGPHGYLKLWIPGSRNQRELHRLWNMLDDEANIVAQLNTIFDRLS